MPTKTRLTTAGEGASSTHSTTFVYMHLAVQEARDGIADVQKVHLPS